MTTATVPYDQYISTQYGTYATYTLFHRAVPDVRDGLKPVQRRIIYAMYRMGCRWDTPPKKSARIVGETMGKYHPHGDSAIYEAMVRLAQPFTLSLPLVDGQGNFGSIDGDPAAAMRYTEARLAEIARFLLTDIDEETVDWVDNFDASLPEPVVLPARFPLAWVIGVSGLSPGISTDILPHNLAEICRATCHLAKNWARRAEVTAAELLKFVPGPDFPTGGIVFRYRDETDQALAAYEQGSGSFTLQARADIQAGDIVITEIPYGLKKGDELSRLADLMREGKVEGISEVRDESSRKDGLRIVIEVKRGFQAETVLESLLANTRFRINLRHYAVALPGAAQTIEALDSWDDNGGGDPLLVNLKAGLVYFINHRLEVITRRSEFRLNKARARLHIVEGLLIATHQDNLDKIIALIRASKTTETARQKLRQAFGLSQIQANAILEMQLRRLVGIERAKLQAEAKDLKSQITDLGDLLNREERRLAVVVAETEEVAQLSASRRTTIVDDPAGATVTVTESDLLIPDQAQTLIINTAGGIYRGSHTPGLVRALAPGKAKRGPVPWLALLEIAPESLVVGLSKQGQIWCGPAWRVPEKGHVSDLGLAELVQIFSLPDLAGYYLLTATAAGKVKRTALADLGLSEGQTSPFINLAQGDRVVAAGLTAGQGQVVLTATTGKTIRFSEESVNPQISGSGVAAMNLGNEGRVIGGGVVETEATFLVIGAEGGYFRRTPLADLPLHNRGGQGVYTWKGWKGVGPPLYSVVAGAEEVITLPGGARVKVSDIYLGGPGLKPAQIGG